MGTEGNICSVLALHEGGNEDGVFGGYLVSFLGRHFLCKLAPLDLMNDYIWHITCRIWHGTGLL